VPCSEACPAFFLAVQRSACGSRLACAHSSRLARDAWPPRNRIPSAPCSSGARSRTRLERRTRWRRWYNVHPKWELRKRGRSLARDPCGICRSCADAPPRPRSARRRSARRCRRADRTSPGSHFGATVKLATNFSDPAQKLNVQLTRDLLPLRTPLPPSDNRRQSGAQSTGAHKDVPCHQQRNRWLQYKFRNKILSARAAGPEKARHIPSYVACVCCRSTPCSLFESSNEKQVAEETPQATKYALFHDVDLVEGVFEHGGSAETASLLHVKSAAELHGHSLARHAIHG
jgi:hypothetical protein